MISIWILIIEPPMDDMNFWKDYEIVAFHRSIGHDFEKAKKSYTDIKQNGYYHSL
jgi:hypothetical protein